ncbi:MAG: glycosyltransferase family 2 protein [Pseudomonadota bacterium]
MQASTHIVVVNYNAGDWLTRSIGSALAHSSGLVTVVDNASEDDSVDTADKQYSDARLQWVKNQDNRGFAAANNQVLAELDADFAVLLNPDCVINQDTLPIILRAFAERPEMGLASCRILNENGSLQPTCRRRFPTPWTALVRMLQLHRVFPGNPKFQDFDYGGSVTGDEALEYVEAVSGAFMVVRKSALQQVGLLDEAYFMHCEDLDWCKRFELAGWRVGFVAAAAVTHAKGISSQSRPIAVLWTLHRGMVRFFDKFYQDQYSWWLRLVVKIGIAASFIGRSLLTLLRMTFNRGNRH